MGEGHCQSKGEGGMIVAIVTVLSNDFINIFLKNRFCYCKIRMWPEVGGMGNRVSMGKYGHCKKIKFLDSD